MCARHARGGPVTEDALAKLGQRVEEAVRATGSAELSTHDVGLAILGPLQELDLVAYLRFASVYRAFDSLEDFEAAIAELREQREQRTARAGLRDRRRRPAARPPPCPPPPPTEFGAHPGPVPGREQGVRGSRKTYTVPRE